MTEKKIYCSKCKFAGVRNYGEMIKDWDCLHPEKVRKKYNPIRPDKEIEHPYCYEINKKNNCKYFKNGQPIIL